MKKYFLIFAIGASILTSCSNDEEVIGGTSSDETNIETRSTLDKIFTVEKVADDLVNVGHGNYMCTDLDGNFYYLSTISNNGMQAVKKYNSVTKEITTLFNIPIGDFDQYGNRDIVQSICIDAQKNLYYTTSYGKFGKVTLVDGSITNFKTRLPSPANDENMALCGLSAAEGGNVFLSGYVYYPMDANINPENILYKIYKITPQGVITEVTSYERGEFPYLKGSHLVKSKGSYVYAVNLMEGAPYSYLKINTVNGNIEHLSTHTPVQAISATHSKDNPYALRGHDIVRLRPTQDSDLLIGTIPSYITENGNLAEMKMPYAFCMNAEATEFYVVVYDNHQKICYKLTLE